MLYKMIKNNVSFLRFVGFCGTVGRLLFWLVFACILTQCCPLPAKKILTDHHQQTMTSPSKKFDGKVRLLTPNLEELAETLKNSLEKNFAYVNVSIVDCPDLTKAPFNLLSKGLGGSQRIADVGGPGNFHPVIRKTVYKLNEICQTAELEQSFVIGAAAGPIHLLGFNSELVINVHIAPNNQSKYASYVTFLKEPTKESPKPHAVRQLTDATANEFTLIGNLLLHEGQPGQVLKVEASRRTGQENFVSQMRIGLAEKYGSQPVGLGGVFLVKKGKLKLHVMPEFPQENFSSKDALEKWLKYFDMDAPTTSTSVFVSVDPDLDIRKEHSHGFSDHGDGGHYHYDISPDLVQYEGYFTPAEYLYRIDRVHY